MDISAMAKASKEASFKMMMLNEETKNRVLAAIKNRLLEQKEDIFNANTEDLERSKKENLAKPLLKRLKFDESKLDGVIAGIDSLIGLDDPVNKTLQTTELDEELTLYKVSCPIGVIGVIFESRPDALVQISTLCLKSGNSVILKGGSEAIETNRVLTSIIKEASNEVGIDDDWIALIESREDVGEILKCDESIDLIIPRGSNAFVKYIMDNSNIPVLGHADGICHCYVDEEANLETAKHIVVDSKTQYVAVCNATETLLVHSRVAPFFLPVIEEALLSKGVIIHGCSKTKEIIDCQLLDDDDFKNEYLDYEIAIRVVDNLDEAIAHINRFGSGHTDAIMTQNREKAEDFMNRVDSGNVFLNCSTRFSDGFRYGFGAEVGISTNKIHARGPVGLDGLLIYKYKLVGHGQIVKDYSDGRKKFTHRRITKDFEID